MKMIVFTMFFSGGMIPTFLLVSNLKMLNTIWALVLPNAIWTYQMLIVRSFYMSIPDSMHESATIDGASGIQDILANNSSIIKGCFCNSWIVLFYRTLE